ncbi:MAG: hypothetical protein HXY43_19170 [Fischerella sp.]|jgi:hypothetical protein|uniref:hypothetical protein n=1 Tax=Fischerella sp. TaxID=1191 RepID=UPI0017A94387|nr:hypothetical protein [Fischerella sp.]NWF61307.1 hypothetical protein [Fischerella sp.]
MKIKILITGVLAFAVSLVTSTGIKAQTPKKASTYQSGYWQPVARFANYQSFVKVKILNKTTSSLQYSLTGGDALNAEIPVGGSATLTTNSLPTYVLIYATQPDVALKYDVAAKDNSATVTIRQSNTDPGDTTLNLHESGAIYVY